MVLQSKTTRGRRRVARLIAIASCGFSHSSVSSRGPQEHRAARASIRTRARPSEPAPEFHQTNAPSDHARLESADTHEWFGPALWPAVQPHAIASGVDRFVPAIANS